MERVVFAVLPLLVIACSGSNFDVADPNADTGHASSDSATSDTNSGDDTTPGVEDTDVIAPDTGTNADVGPALDTSVLDAGPPADALCPGINNLSTDVYVNATAPAGGKGTSTCPFRTLAEASLAPLGAVTVRVVHVQNGTYSETAGIRIRQRETYRAEGGVAKVVMAGSSAVCAPSSFSCAFMMDVGSTIDGFLIADGSVASGIVVNATGVGERPTIRNTTVRNMLRDGILVYGLGAKLGPNAGAVENAHSGMVVRGGAVSVDSGGNSFDRNKGGFLSGSTFIPGSGIHMYGGSLFVDNYASANNNHTGVTFDATGFSNVEQVLSQIDIMSNRANGVYVGKDWSRLQVRKVNIGKNALAGMYLHYNGTASNVFDVGTNAATAPGNNIFGTSTTKNLKAGIFLCQSGAAGSFSAEKNTWTSCAPTVQMVGSCEAAPATYVDIAYAPAGTSAGVNPFAPPTSCMAM